MDAAGAEEVERGGGQVRREGGDPRVPRLLALRAGKYASRAQGRDYSKKCGILATFPMDREFARTATILITLNSIFFSSPD